MVAHPLWERRVAGSNPVTPTRDNERKRAPEGQVPASRLTIRRSMSVKSTVEQLSPTRVRINVEVPFEELKPDFDKAYKALA